MKYQVEFHQQLLIVCQEYQYQEYQYQYQDGQSVFHY